MVNAPSPTTLESSTVAAGSPQIRTSTSSATAPVTSTAAEPAKQEALVQRLASVRRSPNAISEGVFTETKEKEMFGQAKQDAIETALAIVKEPVETPSQISTLRMIGEQLLGEGAVSVGKIGRISKLIDAVKDGSATPEQIEKLRQLVEKNLQKRLKERTALAEAHDQGVVTDKEINTVAAKPITDKAESVEEIKGRITEQLDSPAKGEGLGVFHNMDPDQQNFGNAYKYSRIMPMIEHLEDNPKDFKTALLVARQLSKERAVQAKDDERLKELIKKIEANPNDEAVQKEIYQIALNTLTLKYVQAPEVAILRANGAITETSLRRVMEGASLAPYVSMSRGSALEATPIFQSVSLRSVLPSDVVNKKEYDEEIGLVNFVDSHSPYVPLSSKSASVKMVTEMANILQEYQIDIRTAQKEELKELCENEEFKKRIKALVESTLENLNIGDVVIDTSFLVQFGNPDNPLTFNISLYDLMRIAQETLGSNKIPLDQPLSTSLSLRNYKS